ncbi:hypothetical protein U1Q18_005368 [Sarracenia purpurea var. burkii]
MFDLPSLVNEVESHLRTRITSDWAIEDEDLQSVFPSFDSLFATTVAIGSVMGSIPTEGLGLLCGLFGSVVRLQFDEARGTKRALLERGSDAIVDPIEPWLERSKVVASGCGSEPSMANSPTYPSSSKILGKFSGSIQNFSTPLFLMPLGFQQNRSNDPS